MYILDLRNTKRSRKMKSQKNHVDVRGYEEWDINGKCKRRVPIETYKVGGHL
jgi:hypothetical protein